MADDLDSSDKNVLPSDETSSSDIFDADKTHSVLQDSAEDSQNQIDNSEKEASTDDVSSLSIEKTKAGDAHQKHAQKHDDDDKKKKPKKKRNTWWIKVSIISFVLAAFFSFLSELTADAEHIVVILLLLGFLVVASILFDSIGVAVTSCDDAPIIAMASRKIYGAKTAMWLVKNSGTVASICNDVIGDIFGIISGAYCGCCLRCHNRRQSVYEEHRNQKLQGVCVVCCSFACVFRSGREKTLQKRA